MKRFVSILLVLGLLSSYIGIDLHVDYCGERIEAVHFGESKDSCDPDDCGMESQDGCCSTDEISIEPLILDFTLAESLSAENSPRMASVTLLLFPKALTDGTSWVYVKSNDRIPLESISIRERTQVTLC